ncbi:MAG: hypothetical protein V7607_3874 [Solirubrobacteraceae bacterium]
MSESEVTDRLDRIQATLQLAFAEQLRATSERLRGDPVIVALLDFAAEDWIPSSRLQEQVVKKTGVSARTVRTRLGELQASKALLVRGGGRPEYRSSGLV